MQARAADPEAFMAAALLSSDPPDEARAVARYGAARSVWGRHLRPAERDAWLIAAVAGLVPIIRELILTRLDVIKVGMVGGGVGAPGATRSILAQLLGPPGLEALGALLAVGGLAGVWIAWSGRSVLRGMERSFAFFAVTLSTLQLATASTVTTLRTDVVGFRLIQGAVLGLVVWQGLRLVAWLRDRFDRLDDRSLELSIEVARLREMRGPVERP